MSVGERLCSRVSDRPAPPLAAFGRQGQIIAHFLGRSYDLHIYYGIFYTWCSTGYKAARSPRQVSNINQEAPKSGFMLQNWEARPFRGYYGDGRIAIGGFTSCERGSRSLGQMTLSKRVLAGNTSSPAFDHLQDNL